MQTKIALSTMEAEYIALSQSMRELLPIRELVHEMATSMKFDAAFSIRTHSKVFEDNNGCLILASAPPIQAKACAIQLKMSVTDENASINGRMRYTSLHKCIFVNKKNSIILNY
jgi:hypothetical protein